MIKQLALLLVLSVSASVAHSQYDNWIGLTLAEDGSEVKAAAETIAPVMGDRFTMWTVTHGGPKLPSVGREVAASSQSRWFADCSRGELGLVEYVDYNEASQVLRRGLISKPEMKSVGADSIGELIFQFMCNAEFRRLHTEWYRDPLNKEMPKPSSFPIGSKSRR